MEKKIYEQFLSFLASCSCLLPLIKLCAKLFALSILLWLVCFVSLIHHQKLDPLVPKECNFGELITRTQRLSFMFSVQLLVFIALIILGHWTWTGYLVQTPSENWWLDTWLLSTELASVWCFDAKPHWLFLWGFLRNLLCREHQDVDLPAGPEETWKLDLTMLLFFLGANTIVLMFFFHFLSLPSVCTVFTQMTILQWRELYVSTSNDNCSCVCFFYLSCLTLPESAVHSVCTEIGRLVPSHWLDWIQRGIWRIDYSLRSISIHPLQA